MQETRQRESQGEREGKGEVGRERKAKERKEFASPRILIASQCHPEYVKSYHIKLNHLNICRSKPGDGQG